MKISRKKDVCIVLGFICFLALIYCSFFPTHRLGAIRYQENVYKNLVIFIETNKIYPENEGDFLNFISSTNESRDVKKDFKINYNIDIYSLAEKDGTIYDSNNQSIIFIELKKFPFRLKDRAKTETYNVYLNTILPLISESKK